MLSLGTDLGLGQPMDQGLRATLLAVRLGESLGLGADELADVFYLPTLRFVGCTADTVSVNHYFGDEFAAERELVRLNGAGQSELLRFIVTNVGAGRSPARRIGLVASALATAKKQIEAADRAHCEVATLIAARLGFGERIRRGIAQAFERWDGKGDPGSARGDELEIALRISQVAYTVALLDALDGWDAALATARRRAGGGLDPWVVEHLCAHPQLQETLRCDDPWTSLLELEPGPRPVLDGQSLDAALAVCGAFTDLKSTFTVGHSERVARLAGGAGVVLGLPPGEIARLRGAALVHDLGRVGVSQLVWDKPGALSSAERETVRLNAYYTERMLTRAAGLARITEVACSAFERLDGSGYHRRLPAAMLGPTARVLAAADVLAALGEDRPHRAALTPNEATEQLCAEAAAGRLDSAAVQAVLTADGRPSPRPVTVWPGGLTAREVDVLRQAARGATIRGIAAALGIAPKTADTHLQHAYAKIGVSNRAAAAMYAMQHGLLTS